MHGILTPPSRKQNMGITDLLYKRFEPAYYLNEGSLIHQRWYAYCWKRFIASQRRDYKMSNLCKDVEGGFSLILIDSP